MPLTSAVVCSSSHRCASILRRVVRVNCLPPGMPAMMSAAYGMEIMQDEQKITFFSEHQDALRRVYLDGRKPTPEILALPTHEPQQRGVGERDPPFEIQAADAVAGGIEDRRLAAVQPPTLGALGCDVGHVPAGAERG